MSQNCQFLGSIGAVDVERGIGLRVAAPLGFGQRFGIALALLAHVGEDKVARAVDDPLQGEDLIGAQTLRQSGHDRYAAGYARLKGDRPAVTSSGFENLRAVRGEQCLVRGHDILTCRQQIQDRAPRPIGSAHQLHSELNGRIGKDGAQIRAQQLGRQLYRARLIPLTNHDATQCELTPGPCCQALGLFQQQARHAAADSAATDQGDAEWFHVVSC